MPPRLIPLAMLSLTLGVAGCATPIAPVDVTRFHLGAPIARGTVAVEPQPGTDSGSLEYRAYLAAVSRELSRIGYADRAEAPDFLAVVGYSRAVRPASEVRRSPVTVGVGGGTGGVGLGIGFGIGGGGRSQDVIATQLSVQIKRRSTGEVVWEGRSQTEAREKAPAAQPGLAAARLAEALFRDFPGESGRTITVQ